MKTLLIVALLTITHGYYDYRVDPLPHSPAPSVKVEPQVNYRPLVRKYRRAQSDIYVAQWHCRNGSHRSRKVANARAWRSLIEFNNERLRVARSKIK